MSYTRKASGVIATAEAEFLERIGGGESDPGPVRDYGSSGSGSAAWADLAMAWFSLKVNAALVQTMVASEGVSTPERVGGVVRMAPQRTSSWLTMAMALLAISNSRLPQYVLTEAGRKMLEELE